MPFIEIRNICRIYRAGRTVRHDLSADWDVSVKGVPIKSG